MHFLNLKPCREKKVNQHCYWMIKRSFTLLLVSRQGLTLGLRLLRETKKERCGQQCMQLSQLLSQQLSALSEAQANTIPLYTPRLVNLPFIQCSMLSVSSNRSQKTCQCYSYHSVVQTVCQKLQVAGIAL